MPENEEVLGRLTDGAFGMRHTPFEGVPDVLASQDSSPRFIVVKKRLVGEVGSRALSRGELSIYA